MISNTYLKMRKLCPNDCPTDEGARVTQSCAALRFAVSIRIIVWPDSLSVHQPCVRKVCRVVRVAGG
jgi:hypothetical protein